jgi:L,D-peptidoglycan transpeptidase YkuD (ErfK/YbiS/YcfS/YnhG family)
MGRPCASPEKPAPRVVVRALRWRRSHGIVIIGGQVLRCALGRTGLRADKREGDGATPIGAWPVRRLFYRADHTPRPRTSLPCSRVRTADGWCDAPADRNYNRFVRHPYPASAEHLWRADHLYDLVLVIGHNDQPRRRGAGSAIFLHLARAGYLPTEGCIALSLKDLRRLIHGLRPRSRIVVVA